jgi:acetyl/propionyl-CoA carboxylase alpha subunit
MAVLERAHGVDAVELALRSAAGVRSKAQDDGRPQRAALAAQLRATLPPGQDGRNSGRLPADGRRTRATAGADVVAVSGYDPGDRLDGWYDALLATISAAGPDVATAARAVAAVLAGLADTGVPHDGSEVSAVLERLTVLG